MNKVDFQTDASIQTNGYGLNYTDKMQENLNIIIQFANSVSAVIKHFAELCREHSKKMQQTRPEFEEVRNQLIRERKKRLELEDIIRQRVSATHSDQLPTDTPVTQQERKRPKNAFTLFVTDQRDKILKEHPSLDLYKITTLAAIKWKKLSRQQQLVYQKKLEEMNRITQRQYVESRNKMQGNNDGCYVKKEFGYENEENYNYAYQNEQRQQQKNNGEQQNTINNNIHATFADNQEENPITGTLPFQEEKLNAQEHKSSQKGVIQNMLDLFHTQVEQSYRYEQNVDPIENPSNQIQQVTIQPIVANTQVVVEPSPSLQIIEAANQNNPIVIPPTIQQ